MLATTYAGNQYFPYDKPIGSLVSVSAKRDGSVTSDMMSGKLAVFDDKEEYVNLMIDANNFYQVRSDTTRKITVSGSSVSRTAEGAAMTQARNRFGAANLSNQFIIVSGGVDASNDIDCYSSAERYDINKN